MNGRTMVPLRFVGEAMGAKALEALVRFNSACEKYPFSGIRDCERELIRIVDDLAVTALF